MSATEKSNKELIERFVTGDLMNYALATLMFGKHKKIYRVYVPNMILQSPLGLIKYIEDFVKSNQKSSDGIIIPLFSDKDEKNEYAFEVTLSLLLGANSVNRKKINNIDEFWMIRDICNELHMIDKMCEALDMLYDAFYDMLEITFRTIERTKEYSPDDAISVLKAIRWFTDLKYPVPDRKALPEKIKYLEAFVEMNKKGAFGNSAASKK